ncbi:ATP-binding protein [Opitutus sp. ER46]|uniref:sensor histidine kinase n=1 Tax=Opitutus sp. ER46 TaxID=2161864 RepID=UPI001E3A66D1|nr:ATP-binding protein [Opitutus sp. ER46]
MNTPFHSIRWRIQAWYSLILLAVILAFCATAHQLARDNLERRVDRDIFRAERAVFHTLMAAFEAQSGGTRPSSPREVMQFLSSGAQPPAIPFGAQFQSTDAGFVYFAIAETDGRVILRSPNAPADLAFPPRPPSEGMDEMRRVGTRREQVKGTPEGIRVLIGRDATPEDEDMHRLTLSLVGLGLGVWVVGLLGGWWLAGRAIKPIAAISRAASRVAEGKLDERIRSSGTASELDQLARLLDETFAKLHATFERQRRFTADASHELRTPLTILLSETQRILKRERTGEEYRQSLQTCHDVAARMRHLVESLLLLARQDNGEAPPAPCDLAAIVGETLDQLSPLAAEREIRIVRDLRAAPLSGNAAALAILASNLIVNAIQHNRRGGEVQVSTAQEDDHVVLRVRDDGPGIAPEDLPHVFERFYRADKARTGTFGHAGLGLAIAHAVVTNHRGTLTAESKDGAIFTCRLPR